MTEHTRAERLRLIPFNEIIRIDTGPIWLVRGIIPREGLIAAWGRPKSGKSFIVMDMMMHVALGWDYRGHKVMQGPVVYLAAEGANGVKKRVAGFHHERMSEAADENVDFHLVAANVDLIGEHRPLIQRIKETLPDRTPVAVAIDTLNRTLVGSENSDESMGDYIKAADAIRDAFGCAVVVVHHCGHDDSRMRGHSSLLGALDAQLAIKRDTEGTITMTVQDVKDGEEGTILCSRLKKVELPYEQDGEPVTTCVVEAVDEPAEQRVQRGGTRLSPTENRIMKGIFNALADPAAPWQTIKPHRNGRTLRGVSRLDAADGLMRAGILQRAPNGRPTPGDRKHLSNTILKCVDNGVLGCDEEYIWPLPQPAVNV